MIVFKKEERKAVDFIIAENAFVADIYVDEGDHWGVQRAAGDLQKDIQAVTGQGPVIKNKLADLSKETIFVGTIGKSSLIGRLAGEGKTGNRGAQGEMGVLYHPGSP